MIGKVIRQPVTIVFGLVFGVAAAVASIPVWQWATEAYDDSFPVLKLNAQVIALSADQIVIHASGDKVRQCQYVRLQAYTVHSGGQLHDAQIMRIDQYEDRDNKPVGSFDFGTWRIWPREDATRVQVFSQHLCSGRMVVSKIIDVEIKG